MDLEKVLNELERILVFVDGTVEYLSLHNLVFEPGRWYGI